MILYPFKLSGEEYLLPILFNFDNFQCSARRTEMSKSRSYCHCLSSLSKYAGWNVSPGRRPEKMLLSNIDNI